MTPKILMGLFCILSHGGLKVSSYTYHVITHTTLYCYLFIALNDYIATLDQRLDKKERKELCGIVATKARRIGNPSDQPKPTTGPSWALNSK